MNIDWSGAPEDCIGALVARVGNIHFPKVTFVKSVIHEQSRVRCESCDGSALCAYLDVWAWEDRPWTGEGRPPVGTVCAHRTGPGMSWSRATVLAHGEKKVFYRDRDGHEWSRPYDEIEFRPIRSPEQIASEARDNAVKEMLAVWNAGFEGHVKDGLYALYDSNYRKQPSP